MLIIDVNKMMKRSDLMLFNISRGEIPVKKMSPIADSVSKTNADTLFARKITTM